MSAEPLEVSQSCSEQAYVRRESASVTVWKCNNVILTYLNAIMCSSPVPEQWLEERTLGHLLPLWCTLVSSRPERGQIVGAAPVELAAISAGSSNQPFAVPKYYYKVSPI